MGDIDSKKSEKFVEGGWSDIQEPPVSGEEMTDYAVVFHAGHFYYFGGYIYGFSSTLDSVLRLDGTAWTWSNAGKIKSARYGHGVIVVGSNFMVIGGWHTQTNEQCLLSNGTFTCTEFTSSLTNYAFPAILHLVDANYGNC